MRFGWLAAAAAMVCAVPAGAADYLNVEVMADFTYNQPNPAGTPFGLTLYGYRSVETYSFDLSRLSGQSYTEAIGGTALLFNGYSADDPFITKMGIPDIFGSSVYSFSINPASLPLGAALQAVPVDNRTYTFIFPGRTPYPSNPGLISSVLASVSDGQPLFSNGSVQYAVTFMPEPNAWAMMILGMGAIGFVMRRRRRTDRTDQPVFEEAAAREI